MIVVRGRKTSYIGREQVEALAAQYDGVIVDLDAGDGRAAYRLALAHDARCVIAVTTRRETVAEISARAAKHPQHGGASNALYVAADVEQSPPELSRLADQVLVVLPSTGLRHRIVSGDARVIRGITSIGLARARITIVLSDSPLDDPQTRITPLYTRDIIAPALVAAGARVSKAAWMTSADIAKFEATWMRSLSLQPDARLFHIEARVRDVVD